MNKLRYWKKQLYNANIVYTGNPNSKLFTRAYNLICEINDYLFNLEDED